MAAERVAVSFRVPKTLKKRAVSDAKGRGVSMTSLVEAALGRELRGDPPRWWSEAGSAADVARAVIAGGRNGHGARIVTLTVRLPRDLLQSFERCAASKATTKTRLLREALENEILVEPPLWWSKRAAAAAAV